MMRLLGAILALTILFAAPAAHAACGSPAGDAGKIIYNSTQKIFQYCDDTNWKRMNITPGTGSGGCTNPTLSEGQMVYNADHRILQGCAGNVHRPFTPLKAAGGVINWKQVSAGGGYDYTHACGIKSDDTLWCWGSNASGELGDNTTTQRLVPVTINGGGAWKMVASGVNHTCAIKSDNTLWCWGANGNGQLGDNTTTQRNIPTTVNGGGTWKYVAAGAAHTCGIKTDDTLWCWGSNGNGRTARNTTSGNTLVPTAITGGGTWSSVTAGDAHGCAIDTSANLYCWGSNANGRTGLNTSSGNTLTATGINGGGSWKQVVASMEHSCGIRSDDTIRCWGHNWVGHLGDNTTTPRQVPTALNGGGTWKSISSNYSQHTCAIKTDDTLWCWGYNEEGQLGDGSMSGYSIIPVASVSGAWQQVSAGSPFGSGFTCGIRTNGSMLCWGSNTQGQLANNKSSYVMAPMAANASGAWKSVATGETGGTCAIRADNSLWCWGDNNAGNLGDGTSTQRNIPVSVSGGGTWTQVSKGDLHSCGIKSDQSLWCWGSNFAGQVGDNTQFNSYSVPTAVSGGGAWKYVAAGGSSVSGFTCGIKSDDTLWCWGDNTSGQLGDNSTTQRLIPTAINGGGTWKMVATGYAHACGIKSDDTLWCWGENGNGQLGDNSSTDRLIPTAVNGGGTWKTVATAGDHTCGIRADDTARCWGNNGSGQLGDNTWVNSLVPVTLSGGGTWKSIDVAGYQFGGSHTCGIKTDDTLWCWGTNTTGSLGINSFTIQGAPTAISGGGAWKSVSLSGANNNAYTCALKSDDTLWCWGSNIASQLTETLLSGPSQSSGTFTMCSSPTGSVGSIKFNSAFNLLQFCDGAGWVGLRGGVTPPIAQGLPTSGLVGYWAFNESSGTSAADSSGNGNNGTLTNGPLWTTGRAGGALDFDGTNDFVNVPDNSLFDFERTNSFSISAWIYRDTSTTEDDIIEKVDSTAGWQGYALWLQSDGSGDDDRLIISLVTAASADIVTKTPVGSIPQGAWTHIVVTYSGTGVASGVTAYINGVSQAMTVSQDDLGTGSMLNNNSVTIGTDVANGACCEFDGKIDEVRIYNRVLTNAEIQALAAQ